MPAIAVKVTAKEAKGHLIIDNEVMGVIKVEAKETNKPNLATTHSELSIITIVGAKLLQAFNHQDNVW